MPTAPLYHLRTSGDVASPPVMLPAVLWPEAQSGSICLAEDVRCQGGARLVICPAFSPLPSHPVSCPCQLSTLPAEGLPAGRQDPSAAQC